jgi:DNA-binding MarR family transcriptional regulator
MPAKGKAPLEKIDNILKGLLVLSRSVEHVLESHVVDKAINLSLSSSKVEVLRLLGQRGKRTSTQVARFLGVSKPAVTQIVDAMVRDKLVVRKAASQDRREVHLTLTRRGRETMQSIRRAQRQCLRTLASKSSQAELGRWTKVLEELAVKLVAADKTFSDFCAQCSSLGDGTCVLTGGKGECLLLTRKR